MKAIILAAGEGTRLRPYTLDRPKCLVEVDGRSLLDRQLEVLRACGVTEVVLVKGYLANTWDRPGVRSYLNSRYATTNMVVSLFAARAELEGDGVIVSYGDIVYPKAALEKLLASPADIAVAIDRDWEAYWRARNENPLTDAETLKIAADGRLAEIGQKPKSYDEIQGQYIGLVKYSKAGLATLRSAYDRADARGELRGKPLVKAYMTDLLQSLIDEGNRLEPVAFNGGWVEVDTTSDLELPVTRERVRAIEKELFTPFSFGTKAETLEALRPKLTKAKVCPSVVFTVGEWRRDARAIWTRMKETLSCERLIVRSSAMAEDSVESAMAGLYESVPDVPRASFDEFSAAAERVIRSYAKAGPAEAIDGNQLLVQPMVTNVSMSGVVFTRDLNTGGPYYVVNYDDETGRTDTVTSGRDDVSRTLLVHRSHWQELESPRFRALLEAVVEIEQLCPSAALDIEFAVTTDNEMYLFQVRQIVIQRDWSRDLPTKVDIAVRQVHDFLETRFKPRPDVHGPRSVFGEMSDWNPAEMIGTVPRRLAYSLYRHIITDSIWAEARAAMGYRDLSGRPLMVSLGGHPYIDVRESLNSFLPAGLSEDIGDKLISHWIQKLEARPELHDKIEFEVATTAYPLDFDRRVAPELESAGLSKAEIAAFARELRALTRRILGDGETSPLERQQAELKRLETRRRDILSVVGSGTDRLFSARELIEDCRRFGTKPFSILARGAFVAEELLRSLVRLGTISEEKAVRFRSSVRTVLSSFLDSVHAFQAGTLSREAFLAEYGHLRPGTYNILALRYDQKLDALPKSKAPGAAAHATGSAAEVFSASELAAIDAVLKKEGFELPAGRLVEFMRMAIAGREYAKLKFTHNLSDALELIAKWGETVGLTRDELSHLRIDDLFDSLHETPIVFPGEHFRKLAGVAAEQYGVSLAIKMPYLIRSSSDAFVVPLLKSKPNFVTRSSVQSSTLFLSGQEIRPQALEGKIVLIEGADPGYDWVFMHSIAGLVTKYGGPNSHMAIRCAELNLPAAIGCGEQLFERCLAADEVHLDCGAGLIEIVR